MKEEPITNKEIMPTPSHSQMELICTPLYNIHHAVQRVSKSLFVQMNGATSSKLGVDKVVLDLKEIQNLSSEDTNTITDLLQECCEHEIDFEIVNTTESVYKSLIYASLEFLEVTRREIQN